MDRLAAKPLSAISLIVQDCSGDFVRCAGAGSGEKGAIGFDRQRACAHFGTIRNRAILTNAGAARHEVIRRYE
jgi:hypothetical protein